MRLLVIKGFLTCLIIMKCMNSLCMGYIRAECGGGRRSFLVCLPLEMFYSGPAGLRRRKGRHNGQHLLIKSSQVGRRPLSSVRRQWPAGACFERPHLRVTPSQQRGRRHREDALGIGSLLMHVNEISGSSGLLHFQFSVAAPATLYHAESISFQAS